MEYFDLLTRLVERYSLPLDIGVNRSVKLQALLAAIPGVHDVSAPNIPLNLSMRSGAVLLEKSGVSVLGSLIQVTPDVFKATVQELREIAKGGPHTESSCPDCQKTLKTVQVQVPIPIFGGLPHTMTKTVTVSVPDEEAFARCQLLKSACELRKKLPMLPKQRGQRPLRANISETVLVLLINEQGEKEEGRDDWDFSWCSFRCGFGWRGTERRRAKRAAAQCSGSQSGRRCGVGLTA
jgi:hypothetical protein